MDLMAIPGDWTVRGRVVVERFDAWFPPRTERAEIDECIRGQREAGMVILTAETEPAGRFAGWFHVEAAPG
jgi:hypothetical protein